MVRLSRRQRSAYYRAGYRRAEARGRRERDELASRFEEILCGIRAELRNVRAELARLNQLDGAKATERERVWLN